MVCRGYLKASRPDDADVKWSPGRGCAGKCHRQHVHQQPDSKEAFYFPSLPSPPPSRLLMAEPKSRTDQHEHVEAENRLHKEPVILYWGRVYVVILDAGALVA
jgi:hypothetical protein